MFNRHEEHNKCDLNRVFKKKSIFLWFELFKYNVLKFGAIKKRLSCVSCQNILLTGDVFAKLKVSQKKSVTCAPQQASRNLTQWLTKCV